MNLICSGSEYSDASSHALGCEPQESGATLILTIQILAVYGHGTVAGGAIKCTPDSLAAPPRTRTVETIRTMEEMRKNFIPDLRIGQRKPIAVVDTCVCLLILIVGFVTFHFRVVPR